MDLVNMARPKPNKAEETKCVCEDSYYEKYPWGLRLDLNNDELDKLGIKVKDFDVDTQVIIKAKATVTRISSDKSINDKSATKVRQSLELQITDISIENEGNFGDAFDEATK